MVKDSTARREQGEREGLMLARLLWLGSVRRGDLMRGTGLSAPAASRVASAFFARHAGLMDESSGKGRHVLGLREGYEDKRGVTGAEMLGLVAAQSTPLPYSGESMRWFPDIPTFDIDELLVPRHDDAVVSKVMQAMSQRSALVVSYVSRRRTSMITVSPHRLVRFHSSYYVRGLVDDNGLPAGRTLKITRMRGPTLDPSIPFMPAEMDRDMRPVRLVFRIARGLVGDVRRMIDAEVSLSTEGERAIIVPEAFTQFVIRDMLRPRMMEGSSEPDQPHWELVDRSDLESQSALR